MDGSYRSIVTAMLLRVHFICELHRGEEKEKECGIRINSCDQSSGFGLLSTLINRTDSHHFCSIKSEAKISYN